MKKQIEFFLSNKYLLIVTIIIAVSFSKGGYLSSQNWQWAKGANGSGNDYGQVSCVDASGNVFIGGTFDSPSYTIGSFVFSNNGGTDVFLGKYNSAGTLIWAKTFGGTANETIGGMCSDAAGNIYIAGSFNSPSVNIGTVTAITNIGSTDVYIASYNSVGNALWARRDGGTGADDARGISYSSGLSSVFVAGNFDGPNATFGSTVVTNAGAGTPDVFISLYASLNGLPASVTRGGGAFADFVTDLDIDASNNLYIAGSYNGSTIFGTTTLTAVGGYDALAVKFNTGTNTFTWARNGGGTSGDNAYGVSVDASLNVFLTGSYSSSSFAAGTVTLSNTSIAIGIVDGFVLKYNSAGTIQWGTNIGSASTVIGNDIENDAAGNAYVAIRYSPISNISASAFVNKYAAATGTVVWASPATPLSSGVCSANRLSLDNSGNIYVSGQYPVNGITIGTTTLSSGGLFDAFVAKIGCTSAIIAGTPSVCPGSSVALTVSGVTNFTWSNGATTSSIVVSPTASVSYSVIGSNASCTVNSYPYNITLLTASINAGSNLTLTCGQMQGINAVASPSNPTSVIWSPTLGLIGSTILSPTITAGTNPINYTITATLNNGCVVKDIVNVSSYAPTPQICMVTVDSLGVNNEVYWDKTLFSKIDSFIVYRETSTNIFKRIAAVGKTALSMYTDTARSIGPANGDPNTTSYKYKLQFRDSCGNYSTLSPWHQTIFVQDQQNGNFNWNTYAIENSTLSPVSNYVLNRRNLSTGITNSVSATTGISITDPQYNSLFSTNIKWFVDAQGFNCIPTAKVNGISALKTRTKSNQTNEKTFPTVGVKENNLSFVNVNIYPNPSINKFEVDFSTSVENVDLRLIDVTGKLILIESINGIHHTVNTENIDNGLYFLQLSKKNKLAVTSKIVVQN